MDLPDSDSWRSMEVAEAALQGEEVPFPSIQPILVEAVLNPEHRSMVLLMEYFILRFLQTNCQQVKFPSLSNPYLRVILSLLALYYGLGTVSVEGTRLIARRIPAFEFPSFTLSSIAPLVPEDEMSDNFNLIETSTNLKRQTCGASSSNLNSNQADPRHGRVMKRTSPIIKQPPILGASNFLDQAMTYPTSIAQSQLMQPALPPHEACVFPYVAGNPLCNPFESYMELMQGLIPPSQEPLQDQPSGTDNELLKVVASALEPSRPSMQPPIPEPLQYRPSGTDNELLKVVASALQPSQPSTEPPIQEPLQYQPSGRDSELLQAVVASALQPSRPLLDTNRTSVLPSIFAPPHFHPYNSKNSTYNQLPTLQYGASIAEPSQPPLDPYGQSALPSTLAPRLHSYIPANSAYMEFPVSQSTQPPGMELMSHPRPVAAQPPSTSVAVQNQDVDNVPHQREDDETARSARQRSLQKFLANRSKKKPE